MDTITSNIIISGILIVIFLAGVVFLAKLKPIFKANPKLKKNSFNYRVLIALGMGLVFGAIIQFAYGFDSIITINTTTFIGIFSTVYVHLLTLIVIPLILVSITTAIVNAGDSAQLGKKIAQIISVLIVTVVIAAIVGLVAVNVSGIDANQLVAGTSDSTSVEERQETLEERQSSFEEQNYADFITAPVATDFSFLVGMGDTAALSTVLFGSFLGYSIIQVRKRNKEKVQNFVDFLNSSKEVVLSMVREILKLTPFGIFALMTILAATSSVSSLAELGKFLIATYVAILIMYAVHILIISVQGISPRKYIEKTWPVLVFGFGSRSSMASIPLNVETQTELLGIDESSANLSASFGATIGQNGCAGIYPAMVAVLGAQIAGVEMTFAWYLTLIIVIAVSSFGIAGVGGGATFAAIAVSSIMGLPLGIAATLIAIEPLLDMARTALNVSDSMVAGVTVANMDKTLNREVLNS